LWAQYNQAHTALVLANAAVEGDIQNDSELLDSIEPDLREGFEKFLGEAARTFEDEQLVAQRQYDRAKQLVRIGYAELIGAEARPVLDAYMDARPPSLTRPHSVTEQVLADTQAALEVLTGECVN
jgi:hypothetical protein